MSYRPNDCAYIYNPSTKPVVLMYDSVEYPIKPKQIVPFPGVLCNWFISQFPTIKKLELNEVEVKKAKTIVVDEPAEDAAEDKDAE